MKKILVLFLLIFAFILNVKKVNALTYEEAIKQPKPMVLLIYANWADDLSTVQQRFSKMRNSYGKTYNFVTLNIASDEAKVYNKKYYFYPNLPYILLIRDGGKISRFLQKDCINSESCFAEKLKFFIN